VSSPQQAGRARLFFALWPQSQVQSALGAIAREAQAECGGRATPRDNIHLTLFFIGSYERARVARLEGIAAGITGASFSLELDTLGYWRHNCIIWAGVRHTPGALSALARSLSSALVSNGLTADDRPYAPHVTLVRKAQAKPHRVHIAPLMWSVDDFVLVESVSVTGGARYDVIGRWPLV
jgi:RNA 2',3'-cyclic 3'-phosphodiesterase